MGPTQLDKTEWAQSIGHHMYFGGNFNLLLWNNEAKYAVFNDFKDYNCLIKYMLFSA